HVPSGAALQVYAQAGIILIGAILAMYFLSMYLRKYTRQYQDPWKRSRLARWMKLRALRSNALTVRQAKPLKAVKPYRKPWIKPISTAVNKWARKMFVGTKHRIATWTDSLGDFVLSQIPRPQPPVAADLPDPAKMHFNIRTVQAAARLYPKNE